MNDIEFYRKLDALFTEDVMPQAAKMVFQDYARLNEILMETTRRLKESMRPDSTLDPGARD